MGNYTAEEIIKYLQEQRDIRCVYYDYNTKEKKDFGIQHNIL